jgi:flagellum-specific peptidoglycan hydrolase FlgJ
MPSVRKPRWQQATALVSLSTCGAMTGFAFAHGSVADLTSPASLPVHLLAFKKPVLAEPTSDSALRSAIVQAATAYLRLARDKTPAEMEALIWQADSIGGADHGESCAAFASLVLELGAQATGQQSWVSGGGTYPWPLHQWADVRVEPNPDSPGIISIQQDAQAHDRWHPLGDGYTPEPGDWVLFPGHVEVVTNYAGGVLYTIGGDSMPNFSVNAHQYSDPLAAQGVIGFVNNGDVVATTSQSTPSVDGEQADLGQTAIPGLLPQVLSQVRGQRAAAPQVQQQPAATAADQASALGSAVVPGLEPVTGILGVIPAAQPSSAYSRNQPPATQVPETAAQQAFISEVAPGAVAAQRRYGIPAAVTIAQAIDESGWGQSELATQDHNLFGIKGTGPAGTVVRPTEEYQDGSWVATTASFRVYRNVAQSIADHTMLLATGESYKQAMANSQAPDAFANDLTGVYATDPNYGANLIALMRLYNLYRYDPTPSAARSAVAPAAPQVTAEVAAADHAADLPGLEQTGLALDGSGPLRTAAADPPHAVPRPRGAAQSSVPTNVATHARVAHGAAGRSGSPRGNGPLGGADGSGRGGVSGSGREELAGSGREGLGGSDHGSGRPGTPTRGGAADSAATGVRTGLGTAAQDATGVGGARIPGLVSGYPIIPAARASQSGPTAAGRQGGAGAAGRQGGAGAGGRPSGAGGAGQSPRTTARLSVRTRPRRYQPQIPSVVTTDFVTMAKYPLARAKPLHQDVARTSGVRWELLAACDWMQCRARPQYSPARGERLGAKNPDGTRYRTKSEALAQCAADLITLADAVYKIDLTAPLFLSVLELAQVFAAFRWGGLLKAHHVSAMEFPYSVEGLTVQHLDLPWPHMTEPNAPDKPGSRFRMPFGAVPVVLSLGYPAVA